MTENAILSRHTELRIKRESGDWISVGRLTNLPVPSPETEEIDISALDSPGTAKEYIAGPTDNGSMELVGQYKAGEGGQRLLWELYLTKETFDFVIVAPHQNGVVRSAEYHGTAYVSVCKPFGDATEGDILPFNATLRVTGQVDYRREYVEGEKAPEVRCINHSDGDTFETSIEIELDTDLGPNEIYYTTDSSTPDENSSKYDPDTKITLTATTTLKAICIIEGLEDSEVSSFTFTKE